MTHGPPLTSERQGRIEAGVDSELRSPPPSYQYLKGGGASTARAGAPPLYAPQNLEAHGDLPLDLQRSRAHGWRGSTAVPRCGISLIVILYVLKLRLLASYTL